MAAIYPPPASSPHHQTRAQSPNIPRHEALWALLRGHTRRATARKVPPRRRAARKRLSTAAPAKSPRVFRCRYGHAIPPPVRYRRVLGDGVEWGAASGSRSDAWGRGAVRNWHMLAIYNAILECDQNWWWKAFVWTKNNEIGFNIYLPLQVLTYTKFKSSPVYGSRPAPTQHGIPTHISNMLIRHLFLRMGLGRVSFHEWKQMIIGTYFSRSGGTSCSL